MVFSSELVTGLENLFDIDESLKGNIDESEISLIVDALGCMLNGESKKVCHYMNLLPKNLKLKQRRKEIRRKVYIASPIILILMAIPYIAMDYVIKNEKKQLDNLNFKITQTELKEKQIDKIKKDIDDKKNELKIYDMILSKEVTWSPILNSIDESIPTSVDITKLDVRYDENLVKHNDNGKDQEKTPLYEQIPNLITIEGNASYTRNVGQFLYELNNSIYFKKAKLENLKKDENKGMYSYIIKAYLKEGVVLNG